LWFVTPKNRFVVKNHNNMGSSASSSPVHPPTSFRCSRIETTKEERRNARFYNPFTHQCKPVNGSEEGYRLGSPQNELRLKKGIPAPKSLGVDVGQLFFRFQGKPFVGTGSMIQNSRISSKSLILTCAHNVIHYSGADETYEYAQGGEFFLACTKDNQPHRFSITKVHVYPKYLEKKNANIYSGNDLAVLEFEVIESKIPYSPSTDSFWSYFEQDDLKLKAKLYGYPGEEDKSGDPYEMEGNVEGVVNKPNGKLLAYADIDTTGGQSGSPVFIFRNGAWTQIGVHVGNGQVNRKDAGVATLLTPQVHKWICSFY